MDYFNNYRPPKSLFEENKHRYELIANAKLNKYSEVKVPFFSTIPSRLTHMHNAYHDKEFLSSLSEIMNMTIVSEPIFNYDEKYGLSSYMCWKESGMHVYTWDQTEERPNFMSIDIYTCKDFTINDVIQFTKEKFKNKISIITWRE